MTVVKGSVVLDGLRGDGYLSFPDWYSGPGVPDLRVGTSMGIRWW